MGERAFQVLVLFSLLASVGQAQAPRAGSGALAPEGVAAPNISLVDSRIAQPQSLAVGTIQYDPGAPADAFLTGPASGLEWFGNLFNSYSGQPLQTGTASRITWYQGALPTVGVAFVFAATGGTLLGIFYPALPAANTFNSATVFMSLGPSFIAAQVGRSPGPTWGSVAMRSATTNAQGFHGRAANINALSTAVLSGQNAMIRVTGDLLIPVELLEFEIE